MGMLHQLEQWSNTHHPRWLVVLRVTLGICLFLKGITFMSSSVNLGALLEETNLGKFSTWLPLFITWAHLLGGFLIIIGLLTRWAVFLQIPILLGAIVFVNASKGVFAAESDFGFSLIVLLLLIFFLIEGGGPFSLDNYFKKNPK
jgi:putative oxidoreductase